jgi:hypothetical protein
MERPGVFGEDLAVAFTAGVCVPELGTDDETTKGLDAARVYLGGILRRAGEERLLKLAGVVQRTLVGIDLSIRCGGKESRSSDPGKCALYLDHGDLT